MDDQNPKSETLRLASEYSGPLAMLYDHLHADDGDHEFWLRCAERFAKDQSILELGCGNGRVLVELAAAGNKIFGVDASTDMLDICGERLARAPKGAADRATLMNAHFDTFKLPEPVGMAFFSCDTFQHLVGTDVQLAALTRIRESLAPGGVLILDQAILDVESAMADEGETQWFELYEGSETWTLKVEMHYDYRLGRIFDRVEVTEGSQMQSASASKRWQANAEMALLWPRELFLLLQMAGFRVLHKWASYEEEAFTGQEDQLIIVATPAN